MSETLATGAVVWLALVGAAWMILRRLRPRLFGFWLGLAAFLALVFVLLAGVPAIR